MNDLSESLCVETFNLPKINRDLLCAEPSSTHTEYLLDLAFSFNLKQIVDEPTRVQSNSSSLLDFVFVSAAIGECGFTVEIRPGISVHAAVLFRSEQQLIQTSEDPKEYFYFNNAQDESALDFLEWEYDDFSRKHAPGLATVNALWLQFKNTVHQCVNEYVPQKYNKRTRVNPWITHEIIQMKLGLKRLSRSSVSVSKNSLQALRAEMREKIE